MLMFVSVYFLYADLIVLKLSRHPVSNCGGPIAFALSATSSLLTSFELGNDRALIFCVTFVQSF